MTSTQGPSNGSPKNPWDSVLDALGPILDSVKDYVGDQFAVPANRPQVPKDRDPVADISKIIIAIAGRQVTGDVAELVKKTVIEIITDIKEGRAPKVVLEDAAATSETLNSDLRDQALRYIAYYGMTDKSKLSTNGKEGFEAIFSPIDFDKRRIALSYLTLDPEITGNFTKDLLKELRSHETFSSLDSFTLDNYANVISALLGNKNVTEGDPKILQQINFKNGSAGVIANLLAHDILSPKEVWERFVVKNLEGTSAIPSDTVTKESVLGTIQANWPFAAAVAAIDAKASLPNPLSTFGVSR